MSTTAYEYQCQHCEETYDLVSRADFLIGCPCGALIDMDGNDHSEEAARHLAQHRENEQRMAAPPYDIDLADAQILEDHARVFGVR